MARYDLTFFQLCVALNCQQNETTIDSFVMIFVDKHDKTPPFETWSGEEDFQESCSRTFDVACWSFLDKAAVRLSL